MPLISIVVIVYNTEYFLRDTLDSILAQTMPEFELILVDDGSTDYSGKICDEYQAKDSRIRVIHTENGGVPSARNVGLENARCDYIGFVDSDDLIEPNMYEELYRSITTSNADMAVCNMRQIDMKLTTISQTSHGYPEGFILPKESIIDTAIKPSFTGEGECGWASSVCNKLFLRKAITSNGLQFDSWRKRGGDDAFNLTFFTVANSIVFIDKILYSYIQQPNSITHKMKVSQFDLWKRNHYEAQRMNDEIFHFKLVDPQKKFRLSFLVAEYLLDMCRTQLAKDYRAIVRKVINDKYFLEMAQYTRYAPMWAKVIFLTAKTGSSSLTILTCHLLNAAKSVKTNVKNTLMH